MESHQIGWKCEQQKQKKDIYYNEGIMYTEYTNIVLKISTLDASLFLSRAQKTIQHPTHSHIHSLRVYTYVHNIQRKRAREIPESKRKTQSAQFYTEHLFSFKQFPHKSANVTVIN